MSLLHRLHKGQSYRLAGTVDHTCRDGRETTLEVWLSLCVDCGAPFEFKRPQGAKHFWPNRRCKRCKRPGVRVGKVQL